MSLTNEIPAIWERCTGCQREYRYPHLCRTHMLCGLCHPPVTLDEIAAEVRADQADIDRRQA